MLNKTSLASSWMALSSCQKFPSQLNLNYFQCYINSLKIKVSVNRIVDFQCYINFLKILKLV